MKRLLDVDEDTTEVYHDTETGCVIETRSNIADALMRRNRELRNSGSMMQGNGMRYVGSVDPVEFMRWCAEDPEFVHDSRKLYKKLRLAENAGFRTVDKRRL